MSARRSSCSTLWRWPLASLSLSENKFRPSERLYSASRSSCPVGSAGGVFAPGDSPAFERWDPGPWLFFVSEITWNRPRKGEGDGLWETAKAEIT